VKEVLKGLHAIAKNQIIPAGAAEPILPRFVPACRESVIRFGRSWLMQCLELIWCSPFNFCSWNRVFTDVNVQSLLQSARKDAFDLTVLLCSKHPSGMATVVYTLSNCVVIARVGLCSSSGMSNGACAYPL